MATAAIEEASGKVVIKNIGLLLSGDIDQPILQADTIVVMDGIITAVGRFKDLDTEGAKTTIDVRQTCVAPCVWRLDTTAKPNRLDRLDHERRGDHHGVCG